MSTYSVNSEKRNQETIEADGVRFENNYVIFFKWRYFKNIFKKPYLELVKAYNQNEWTTITRK